MCYAVTIGLIVLRSELIRPDRRIVTCRDPQDDKFLEVAASGRAQVIVSGDNDLLILGSFERIPIVSPARFLAMLDAGPMP